jgi:hypothetical protein
MSGKNNLTRKKVLQFFLDKVSYKDIERVFGDNSRIIVRNLSYVRSKKSTLVNATLYVNDPTKLDDLFPTGVEWIINRAWNGIGDKTPLIIHISFDLIENI